VKTVANISERTKQILKPREKFLVLEVTPAGTNALFLSVDEDHNLILEKSVSNADLKKFLKSPLRQISQKTWEGNYFFKSHRKVIVSADPSVATTMPIPLDLSRERSRWNDEITLTELENLIAQAMAKIFTQCRNEAAKRIGIDDIHTILVGAKANRFKIDNHSVMNPIGFTGRKLSLLLELTFTSREVFENLRQFFKSPDEFFFIESPQASLLAINRSRPLPLNIIHENASGGATLFVFQKVNDAHPVLYREKLPWSFDSIFARLGEELGVSAEVARELYHEYRSGNLSEAAKRGFKRALQPSVDALLDAIEKAKISGSVFFDADHPAPFDLPHKHKGVTFAELPVAEILTELGLQTKGDISEELIRARFRHIAPFLESYFAKSVSEINQKLRRRLHWLAE
jgi:hypothetical protein